eukprot:GILJ01032675.1.p1 GENE.GILJ01032675.1~~GILJ01032675.1.p1  ORF type:complete len:118 (+),score=12.55 GILJ01032675.1:1-354(+)
MLRLLIDSSANVSVLDKKARSALHIAAKYYRTACAQLLLESGADVVAIDNEGNTPKMSIRVNNDGSCERLLERYESSAPHSTVGLTVTPSQNVTAASQLRRQRQRLNVRRGDRSWTL